jgi:hypothetical protein
VLELLIQVGGVEEGLGRDAAAEEAGAAQAGRIALDGGHAEPHLGGPDGRHVAPGTGPDHRDVEFPVGHSCSSR